MSSEMAEIERRSGALGRHWWQFLPAGALIGAGYCLTLLQSWWAVPLSALGVAAVALPLRHRPRDLDVWRIPPPTPGERRRMWLRLLIPAAILSVDILAGDPWFSLSATASAVLSGVGMGLAATLSTTGIARAEQRTARERIRLILQRANPDEVNTSDLDAVDSPESRQLIHALLANGAVDGTRVMARQLARVLAWEVARVHAVATPLQARGIITRSTIMAAGDRGRIFVELTEKGVCCWRVLNRGEPRRPVPPPPNIC